MGFLLCLSVFFTTQEVGATAFVHLFEWTWNDIARECEDFLGPAGYAAVQISPPNEHRLLLGRPWYERYQPLSYKLTSRSGSRAEFIAMIERCHGAGVSVYADAVINHMASCRPACDAAQPQYGDMGVGGSSYELGAYRFTDLFATEDQGRVPGALDTYQYDHFHHLCDRIDDYGDTWQVQHCELERLADLATEREDVRATIANYLATLFVLGIDGVRIDAAKHLSPGDLNSILWKAATAANVHIEDTDINQGAPKTVLVFQEFIGRPPNPAGSYANGKVTEFEYGKKLGEKFLYDQLQPLNGAVPFGEGWGLQSSINAVAFIDNHDNQRGHGGGGQVMKDFRNSLDKYTLANVFMLAWPYGYPKVMSSYRFGNGEIWAHDQHSEQDITQVADMGVADDFLGPPHNGSHQGVLASSAYSNAASWTTRRVWVDDTAGGLRNSCFDTGSKWMCEHRWRPIANMVGFRNAVNANWDPVANWWDNGERQIAFSRGALGFVAINAQTGSDPEAFGPEGNGWIQTGLPPGDYCDVIHSTISQDKSECLSDAGAVSAIRVHADGKANLRVNAVDAVALHVGARLLGNQTSCSASSPDWQRTVVFVYGPTIEGQDMFFRGGIDHGYAQSVLGLDCENSNGPTYECAIPIRHRNLHNATTIPWKEGDDYLDWYDQREPNQNGWSHAIQAQGTAVDWSTNNPDHGVKVATEGYGYEVLNDAFSLGEHYWMMDVDMDCARAVCANGEPWFELKSYISNIPNGWEGSINQAGTPYGSGNHFAKCGKINVFRRHMSEASFFDFP
jgi:alpha-amylase